ncbi:hypothetical protein Trydic_g13155 [Trypoxylus dichotomus]
MSSTLCNILSDSFITNGEDAMNTRSKLIESILQHKKIPEEGWSEKMIEDLLLEITCEKQEFSTAPFGNDMVSIRNYNIYNGTTLTNPKLLKSEDLSSNVGLKIAQLGNAFVNELIKTMGIKKPFDSAIIPVATGMSLLFSMLTFRSLKPTSRYVIWSRIDQKSCFKSIVSAGCIPIIVDTQCVDKQHITLTDTIEEKIKQFGAENICCVMSTTSCFAPRACDDIEDIAKICHKNDVFHLINNAYGLSNRKLMKRINKASVKGRVSIFVQSTDKNLCVPVGGAIVACFDKQIFSKFTDICSENMSISPIIDVVVTLLNIGKDKYLKALDDCESIYDYLKSEMVKLAGTYNEEVITNPGNPISIALTLTHVPKGSLTQIGSMLYTRNISGVRVVTAEETTSICDYKFQRWGTHCNNCGIPYLTAAASIGILRTDVDIFIKGECVGFDSVWRVKRVYTATSAQTTEFSSQEHATNTTLSRVIETQTDSPVVPNACDVDMNKLSSWLQKMYPCVSRELNDSINSSAFKNYRVAQTKEQPIVKLMQKIKVQECNGDDVCRISTLSWNATGNTLAVACNQFHKTWCYHPGMVSLYTFDRNDRVPDNPTKRLASDTCINVVRFHPRSPSVIAAGTQSGNVIVWNIQHDDGENEICKINAHEEIVTHLAWINDMDTAKTPLLATSSLDGYLCLWNFDPVDESIRLKHKYQVKSPLLLKKSRPYLQSEEISKKVVRGINTFDFSPYFPEIFIVGAEGGLVIQCSLLGTVRLKESTNDVPVSDPVYKYYDSHEGEISKISFSPNRKEMFLTCGINGEIRIYVLNQDEPCKVISLENPLLSVSWILFHEKILVGCGSRGVIEIFKLQTGEPIDITIKDYVDAAVLTQIELNNRRMGTVAVGTDSGLLQIWIVPWNLYNCIH